MFAPHNKFVPLSAPFEQDGNNSHPIYRLLPRSIFYIRNKTVVFSHMQVVTLFGLSVPDISPASKMEAEYICYPTRYTIFDD